MPIALQLLWKGLFGRGSSMLAKKNSHPVEPSTLKSRHRRDRHVRQVKYDTGWGTEASQSANPRPLRARKERDEQGQKGGGKKEDPVGGMQDGGRGLRMDRPLSPKKLGRPWPPWEGERQRAQKPQARRAPFGSDHNPPGRPGSGAASRARLRPSQPSRAVYNLTTIYLQFNCNLTTA